METQASHPDFEPKTFDKNIWVTSLSGRMPKPETFAKKIEVVPQSVTVIKKGDLYERYINTAREITKTPRGNRRFSLARLLDVSAIESYAKGILEEKDKKVVAIPLTMQFHPVSRSFGILRDGHIDSYEEIQKFLKTNTRLEKPMEEHKQVVQRLVPQAESTFPQDLRQILFVFVR